MKTYVMIPTYNERENINALIGKILKLKIKNLHIAVVDDNSPDGTWKIVEDISKKNKNVHLLLRKTDKGRGSAGRDGFIYCLKHNAGIVIEMDADMSHDPKYIPLMIEELKKKIGIDFGSGYLSDPLTVAFLNEHYLNHAQLFRKQWGPYKALIEKKVQMTLSRF